MSGVSVRAVRPEEWRLLRDTRLEALRDPDASLAFTSRLDRVAAHSEELWRERARSGSEDAGPRAQHRTFAVVKDMRWLGTLTVLVGPESEAVGEVVAVWVRPEARGSGAIDSLVVAAANWAVERGLQRLGLWVRVENARARRAYEKSGFGETGEVASTDGVSEIRMTRSVLGESVVGSTA